MAVVETDKWLKDYIKKKGKLRVEQRRQQKEQICEKLIPYFQDASSADIHQHLLYHGLFLPGSQDKELIESLIHSNCWNIIEEGFAKLKKEWDGPDVPVFIFPSDLQNKKLQADFNGLSGLSYQDKVFLFAAGNNTKEELQKLLTHEYNHVCRLHYLDKREDKIELLDSIVLEGLAEMAVQERLGKDHLAKWASIYDANTAQKYFKRWLEPNLTLPKKDRRHHDLLYGEGFIPRWAGYNVGFHIVSSYMKNKQKRIKGTLHVPAETIYADSDFSS
ncbi:hypothetical protein GCM10011409_18500 [Lentibacillus populi]|uniref:DUF2268 domain-containing protein n=1 Tax=Lentibacillus populi TaxID=1827502 RepID=A0A9W5TXE7_9BACI|nr:DUF2268 domain-containing protein [Lentibacillus populi]GGB41301.1 hypothetical protein GCM10011409_18500 [Lentibacillus populi]